MNSRDTPLPVLAVDLVADPSLLAHLPQLARELEGAGIGALTISDGGLHPIHVASYIAPLTSRAALLPRTDAVYVEPFHLATQLMSLDHISAGRAGWLLTAETDPEVARTVGRTALDLAATAREAADVLQAARLVWDSWADDAVVRDTERGLYLDASRLQYVDFVGENFSVRGPAITPRSPQGLVPTLVADTDRDAVGARVSEELADGRVFDIDVSGGAHPEAIASAIREASGLQGAPATSAETADASGGTEPANSSATDDGSVVTEPARPVRLVRLVGLDLGADAAGVVAELATELRRRGLIAAPPTAGTSLREQLGLPRPVYQADPLRRSDRARRSQPVGTADPAHGAGPATSTGSARPTKELA